MGYFNFLVASSSFFFYSPILSCQKEESTNKTTISFPPPKLEQDIPGSILQGYKESRDTVTHTKKKWETLQKIPTGLFLTSPQGAGTFRPGGFVKVALFPVFYEGPEGL